MGTLARLADFIPNRPRPARPYRPLPPRVPRPTPPNDAPWPEPPHGISRRRYVWAMLKEAYRGAGLTPINCREETETGRALHPRFVDQLEVRHWVREPYLTARQVQIVELIARDDRLTVEIAERLDVGESTVKRDIHDATETLIRAAWAEPGFVLPYRVYTRRPDS